MSVLDSPRTGRNVAPASFASVSANSRRESTPTANSRRFFRITEGLDCPHCAQGLEEMAAGLPGISAAAIHFSAAKLEVAFDAARPETLDLVMRRAGQMGFTLRVQEDAATATSVSSGNEATEQASLVSGRALAFACCLAGLGAGLLFDHFGPTSHLTYTAAAMARIAYGVSVACGGVRFARAGIAALRSRIVGTHLLMTVAALGALVIGHWEEASMTVALYTVGLALEGAATERTRRSLRGLIDATPDEAVVQRADLRHARVPVAEIAVGDVLVVPPGAKVAADGVVISGRSALSQAAITGESLPVDAERGSTVFAGSLNGNGSLLVRVTQTADDSTIAQMLRLVEEAQNRKAPLQSATERFGRIYTPAVLLMAVALALVGPLVAPGGPWLYRALTLLVVACPCALVIATPVAYVSAIARAARDGVLVRGGDSLEALAGAQTLFFDKTGTLTTGDPRLTGYAIAEGGDANALLDLAAAVERHSEHPIALAIEAGVDMARLGAGVSAVTPPAYARVAEARALPGFGVSATLADGTAVLIGKRGLMENNGLAVPADLDAWESERRASGETTVFLAVGGFTRAVFAVADTLRSEAPAALSALRRTGRRIVLLTGDQAGAADRVGHAVGIDKIHAGLLPQDKLTAVESATTRGATAFIGDGINDAPALAAASVGIAMGASTGTQAAMYAAGIVLMRDDLRLVPQVVGLAQATQRTVRVNIVLSVAAVVLLLLATALGHVTLPMGVLAHEGSALLVILNGLRLLMSAPVRLPGKFSGKQLEAS